MIHFHDKLLAACIACGAALVSPAAPAQTFSGGHGHGRIAIGAGAGSCRPISPDQLRRLPAAELSEPGAADIRFLREEEKLARDVYLAMSEVHALPIFSNIARAEQRHMDAVGLLISRYGLEDPVTEDARGAFTNAELRSLYDELVARGTTSPEAALRVGATVEDMDLADLMEMIDTSDNADIDVVASALAAGSRNHLRAFSNVLARHGFGPYAPTFLDADTVAEILASDHEPGRRHGQRVANRGPCGRRGSGRGAVRPGPSSSTD